NSACSEYAGASVKAECALFFRPTLAAVDAARSFYAKKRLANASVLFSAFLFPASAHEETVHRSFPAFSSPEKPSSSLSRISSFGTTNETGRGPDTIAVGSRSKAHCSHQIRTPLTVG